MRKRHVVGLVMAWCLTAAIALAAGRASLWIVADTVSPHSEGIEEPVSWRVEKRTVGRKLRFSGELRRKTSAGPLGRIEGIVTGVNLRGVSAINVGSQLFSVNLRPVIAGQGEIPAFRTLKSGVSGPDVRQLRGFLCSLGHGGCGGSDEFTAEVGAAVKNWQKASGMSSTGTVHAGDIMWFDKLPVQAIPTENLEVGREIAPGEPVVSIVSQTPALVVTMTEEQAGLVSAGMVVRRKKIQGHLGTPEPTEESILEAAVVTEDGSTGVCATTPRCAALLGSATSRRLKLEVEIVPQTTGPAVPVRAIRTSDDGTTSVRNLEGDEVVVSVRAQSSGIAIVDGLRIGDELQLLGEEDDELP